MGLFFKKHPKNGCFFFWHPFFGCFLKKAPISSKTTFFSLQPLILILRTSHFKYEIRKTFFRPLLFLFCPTTISIVQTTVTQNGCQKWVPKNGCQKWVPVLERLLIQCLLLFQLIQGYELHRVLCWVTNFWQQQKYRQRLKKSSS